MDEERQKVRPNESQLNGSLPVAVELTSAESRMYGYGNNEVEDFDVTPYCLPRKSFSTLSKTPHVILRPRKVTLVSASQASLGIPAIPELRQANQAGYSSQSRIPSINLRQRESRSLWYTASSTFRLRNGGEIPAVVSDERSPETSRAGGKQVDRDSLNLPYLDFNDPSTSLQGRITLAPKMSKRRQSIL